MSEQPIKKNPLNIIIVEKNGNLKPYSIKEFNEADLYKKCGFKSSNGFDLQKYNYDRKKTLPYHFSFTWKTTIDKITYFIFLYGKTSGRENHENKYDFPPPVDKLLFFGNCALVAGLPNVTQESSFKNSFNTNLPVKLVNLSIDTWNKIYEKLFGGFENLNDTEKADNEEEDELDNIPDNLKTKEGYLKDGFVVSSSEDEIDDELDDELVENLEDELDNDKELELDDDDKEEDENESVDSDNKMIKKKVPLKKRPSEKKRFENPHFEKFNLNNNDELCEENYEYDDSRND